jgi:competence protein ComEC
MMLLFQWMLSPLKLIPKGPYLHLILTFLLLWGYAFMVGASASVVRSVTLFSAINIGMLSQKKLPTYYYVLLSLGILVFIKPRYILQLGFQMSYLAVFGILFIYPLINIRFKNRFLRYFWNLTALTLAAQLTVAPLSIYHFNQFPGLFLLSNWVLLPFISLFLSVGLGYMILSLISRPPDLITSLLNEVIALLNQFCLLGR